MRPLLFFFILFSFSHSGDAAGNLILKYLKTKQENPAYISHNDKKSFNRLFSKIVSQSLFSRKKRVSQSILKNKKSSYQGRGIFRVYGTSFGKPGNKGETNVFKDGSKVKWGLITAALPHVSIIGKFIKVRMLKKNGKLGRWIRMKVRDLGPWFRDDPYWKTNSDPRAIHYFKHKMRRFDGRVVKNPAGIDLTPWAWQKLGIAYKKSMNHSGWVEWKISK
ncbi:MAG: hypothetical protein COB02_07865 [Candidatus Cloacimonadota bacterium]|nr:MAG: hypothetical protein COB02_07865 [Candidatus Cloacimonadota bacterium]